MFKGNDNVLAIDIGSAVIKVVELEIVRGRVQVRHASSIDLPAPSDGDRGEGRPEMLPRVVTALADLLAGLGIKPNKSKRLVTSLPATKVSIKQIKSLSLPESEMRSALVFEARKHMPVEGDILMDFQVLGQRGEECDVLMAVTTKQAVQSHHSTLEACGFTHARNGLIEAPALALWNAFLSSRPDGLGKQPQAVLSLGAVSTHLSFFYESGLFLHRDIPIAGDKFTEDIRQLQGLDFMAAEKAKAEGCMFRSETKSASTATMTLELENEGGQGYPSLQSLVRELQRSIRFYLKESGQSRLASMALAGGGAADIGLRDHLSRELGLTVETFDPFRGLEMAAGVKVKSPGIYAQATGMALRGLHEFFPHQLK
jgi:type IV pilus assembly protein PilM